MNPIKVKTKHGMKTLGRLLRVWALDAGRRPDRIEFEHDRLFVISRGAFVEALRAEGTMEGVDYELREGIKEIELLTRGKDSLTLALPEANILKQLMSEAGGTTVSVTSVDLFRSDFSGGTLFAMDLDTPEEGQAQMYDMHLAAPDPFEELLDAYMAAYSVSQCR